MTAQSDSTESSDKKGRPGRVLIVLVLLFSAPMLSSWILFNYTDLISGGGLQHGDLYDPLVKLPNVPLVDPLTGELGSLYGQWSLLYMNRGPCKEECQYMIYSMRQIRLALARYANNLQRVWMTDIQDPEQLKAALVDYGGTQVLNSQTQADRISPMDFALPPIEQPLTDDSLYVIDPRGYLVMRYREGAKPGGIISDVKRLLKTSSPTSDVE